MFTPLQPGDVGARVVSAAELHVGDERILALLVAHDGRAVRALRLAVASSRDTNALVAGEALEGVPVLLTRVEVRLVGHAGGAHDVVGIHDEVGGLARVHTLGAAQPAQSKADKTVK